MLLANQHVTVAIALDIYSHVIPNIPQDVNATVEQVLHG
jgi:hypothetical protein